VGKASTRLYKNLKREDGNNLVEVAITVIFYFLMLFGVIDFSRALYTYHFVGHAAREGARWAIVNGSTCSDDLPPSNPSCPFPNGAGQTDVATHVKNFIPPGINPANVSVTAPCGVDGAAVECAASTAICTQTTDGSFNAPGCVVQVTVTYPFNFLVPLIGTTLTMSSTSEMVISH
jgi:hypothetical protein